MLIKRTYTPTAHIVHGLNVGDFGRSTVGRLEPYFITNGYYTNMVNYGWTGIIGAVIKSRQVADNLVKVVHEGDIGISHSWGAGILLQSVALGAPFKKLVFINPALPQDTPAAAGVEVIHVWHSPSDKPVKMGRLAHRWFSSTLVSSIFPYGAMGAYGAHPKHGKMGVYINYDKENDFEISSKSHSDMFDYDKLPYFAPLIVENL